jgi:hypothetical protein
MLLRVAKAKGGLGMIWDWEPEAIQVLCTDFIEMSCTGRVKGVDFMVLGAIGQLVRQ